MKKVLLISALTILTILSSCKKDEEDQRNKFVGTWAGSQTTVIPGLGVNDVSDYVQIMSLSSDNANKIIITVGGEIQKAEVKGSLYNYDNYSYTTDDGSGNTMTMEMIGSGTLSGNKINETGTLKLYYMGQEFPGTWTGKLTRQ